ncbi:MAG: hypothetical protein EA404_07960 [Spirochaetaceae bacterium]|nr:MAG: hypothetical protein EA404_07960 [Spirochaetaceae bacterium]
MTLTLRNTILRVSLALIVITSIGAAVALVRLQAPLPSAQALGIQTAQRWLFVGWRSGLDSLNWLVGGLFVVSGFSVVAAAIIMRYFRKTTAPEMLFFVMFILAIGFDVWKVGHVVLHLQQMPVYFAVALTRLVQFAHLFGVLCLFVSTLYLTGVEYKKTGMALSLAALISLSIVYAIPVDHLALHPNLVHKIGDQTTIQAVVLILHCLTVANVVYATAYQRNEEYLILLPMVVLAIIGRELIFYLPSMWLAFAGFVLLVTATAVFGYRMHTIYLWK